MEYLRVIATAPLSAASYIIPAGNKLTSIVKEKIYSWIAIKLRPYGKKYNLTEVTEQKRNLKTRIEHTIRGMGRRTQTMGGMYDIPATAIYRMACKRRRLVKGDSHRWLESPTTDKTNTVESKNVAKNE